MQNIGKLLINKISDGKTQKRRSLIEEFSPKTIDNSNKPISPSRSKATCLMLRNYAKPNNVEKSEIMLAEVDLNHLQTRDKQLMSELIAEFSDIFYIP